MSKSSSVSIKSSVLCLYCVCVLFLCAGCAASSTIVIEEEVVTNPKPMYRYTSIVIQDLELKPEMYTDSPTTEMGPKDIHYGKLPGELSDHIARNIRSRGIYKYVSRGGKLDDSTLLLTGRFIRLGRFKVTVVVSLRDGATGQEVASFRQTLWDVLDTVDSFGDLGREVADFIYRIQYK